MSNDSMVVLDLPCGRSYTLGSDHLIKIHYKCCSICRESDSICRRYDVGSLCPLKRSNRRTNKRIEKIINTGEELMKKPDTVKVRGAGEVWRLETTEK